MNVQKVLPDVGSTSYKEMLAVLALHLVLLRPVSQFNDHDMNPLLPHSSRHFGYIHTHVRMHKGFYG